MTHKSQTNSHVPFMAIDVAESTARKRPNRTVCRIDQHISFCTQSLETYCIRTFEPIVYDALLLAAAVEFADRRLPRRASSWHRQFDVQIPVHDPALWNSTRVSSAIHDALCFLTGDEWNVTFRERIAALDKPQQCRFDLPSVVQSIIPYSDGLDSRIVAGLLHRELGDSLVRVRLGSQDVKRSRNGFQHHFTAIPYDVKLKKGESVESSMRSRGFKFALISGLAAYLARAKDVIVSESGQGSLGPPLVTVGQGYDDYRTHPRFTQKMERLLYVLLGHSISFQFPRIWSTKAETLARFVAECPPAEWADTRSCWQGNRQVGVDAKLRQCGICAACMLRRMSVHAAGFAEESTTYVWENLRSATLHGGAAQAYPARQITGKQAQYALAGTLHLDHLAGLQNSNADAHNLKLNAFQLSRALDLPELEVLEKLSRLLSRHETEWKHFVESLGEQSFVAKWALNASL